MGAGTIIKGEVDHFLLLGHIIRPHRHCRPIYRLRQHQQAQPRSDLPHVPTSRRIWNYLDAIEPALYIRNLKKREMGPTRFLTFFGCIFFPVRV
jgi:hypothetical protein